MNELDIMHLRGRDNVGGVVIAGAIPDWTDGMAEKLCHKAISISDLEIVPRIDLDMVLEKVLLNILRQWEEADVVYDAALEGKRSKLGIAGQLIAGEHNHYSPKRSG
jgi:hypothetical protein